MYSIIYNVTCIFDSIVVDVEVEYTSTQGQYVQLRQLVAFIVVSHAH